MEKKVVLSFLQQAGPVFAIYFMLCACSLCCVHFPHNTPMLASLLDLCVIGSMWLLCKEVVKLESSERDVG